MTDPALDDFLARPKPTFLRRYGKWIAVVIGVVLLALLLSRCFGGAKPIEYQSEEVKRGTLAVTVTATGNLAPTNQIQVGSEISGIVERVLVDVNDHVARGQPIAIVDTSRLDDAVTRSAAALGASDAAVAQARATVAEAAAQLERLREVSRLSGGRVPSQTELAAAVASNARAIAALHSAQANVVSARAQLSSDRTQQDKAVIRSPVSGVVLTRQIDPGQTVAASFNTPTLFVIAEDLAAMKLAVAIDEADVGEVREGLPASFTVDAFPGREFPATIRRVNVGATSTSTGSSSSVATATSTVVSYTATLAVSNPDLILRPGMTATATIGVEKAANALLVPNAALRFVPGAETAAAGGGLRFGPPGSSNARVKQERGIGVGSRQTVYVLGTDGKPRAIAVVTGMSDGRFTAVTSRDLKPGMKVLTGRKAAAL